MRSLPQIRVLNDEGGKDAEAQSESDDVFLRKIEATMLTQVCALCLFLMTGMFALQVFALQGLARKLVMLPLPGTV